MKLFAFTFVIITAHLLATLSARAGDAPLSASPRNIHPCKAPEFITKGKPLTIQELTDLKQHVTVNGNISQEAAGSRSAGETAFIVVVAAAVAIGACALVVADQTGGL